MQIIWIIILNPAWTHRPPRRRTRGRQTRSRGRTTHPPGPAWPAAASPSTSCSLPSPWESSTLTEHARIRSSLVGKTFWNGPVAWFDARAGWQGPLGVLGVGLSQRLAGMRRWEGEEEEEDEEEGEEEEEDEPVLTSVFKGALRPPRLPWACLTARTSRCPFILASGRTRKKSPLNYSVKEREDKMCICSTTTRRV